MPLSQAQECRFKIAEANADGDYASVMQTALQATHSARAVKLSLDGPELTPVMTLSFPDNTEIQFECAGMKFLTIKI